jgi:Icc-related predicted phosphoesterase
MKILYVTDLHGIEWKFHQIYQSAISLKVDIVINGGDLFPFKGNLLHQDKFISNFLGNHFSKYESQQIYYLTMLGNDDLRIFDDLFQKFCDKYLYVENVAQKKYQIEGYKYEFIGMNWVTDLPFGLKDRVRKDTEDFEFPGQFGNQFLSIQNGWEKIEDWFSYANSLPTIEDEMRELVKPSDMKNTIYIIHMPPSNLGLDVCHDGRKVGSKAIYEFLKKNQPKVSLHGHIHESPEVSGEWYSSLDNTICIQPGQSHYHEDNVKFAVFDLDTMNLERKIVKKDN